MHAIDRTPRRRCIAIALALASTGAAFGQARQTPNWPATQQRTYDLDSGDRPNLADHWTPVFRHEVKVDGASWLRLHFGPITLGAGGFVRVTSVLDGEVQQLDAVELQRWGSSTAYFNGDTLIVELVAGPDTLRNRMSVRSIEMPAIPVGGAGVCGICGATDDRVPSSENWTGRLLPAGCTASIYNEDSCIVSAGHCVDGTGADVIQFNVPPSNPNCTINNPPIADQFPIVAKEFANGGVGNDWSALLPGTNNLGQLPYERYSELRPLAATTASVGQTASVTGYGTDTTCTLSQTQRTASGPITAVFGSFYEFTVDLTGGNSGSALIHNDEIIGVVTHCPCNNAGTRIDLPAFVVARELVCCPGAAISNCCFANGSPGCDDGACESIICGCDPFCCDTEWDSFCAGEGFDGSGCGAALLCTELCTLQPCDSEPCPWDIVVDGQVDTVDFLVLLGSWGPNPGDPADINGDGFVDTVDFLMLIGHWGPCP